MPLRSHLYFNLHIFSGNLLRTKFPNEIALFLFDYIQIFSAKNDIQAMQKYKITFMKISI